MSKRMSKYIFLVAILFSLGCSPSIEQPSEPFSSDNEYLVRTGTSDENTITIYIIHKRHTIGTYDTGASIYKKFSVSWSDHDNVLILYSNDIGIKAWSAKNRRSKEIDSAPYNKQAELQYKLKYGKST